MLLILFSRVLKLTFILKFNNLELGIGIIVIVDILGPNNLQHTLAVGSRSRSLTMEIPINMNIEEGN